ncbi:MAG: hypothetical protein ACRD2N_26420 [Vicinamibacterales bacterium]
MESPTPAADYRLSDTRILVLGVLLTIALGATALAYVARMVAVFPLEHDVTEANSAGEDWLHYHQNALSVVNDGLTMPGVTNGYFRPGGFGYVYFVAAVDAIAGVRSEVVYAVQGRSGFVTMNVASSRADRLA